MKLITFLLISLFTFVAQSAVVVKVSDKIVLLTFSEKETLDIGDRLKFNDTEIVITRVKKSKAKAIVLNGEATVGMILEPQSEETFASDETSTQSKDPSLVEKDNKERTPANEELMTKIDEGDDWSAVVTLMSTHVWRGLDLGRGQPLVVGALNYQPASSFKVGTKIYNRGYNSNSRNDFYMQLIFGKTLGISYYSALYTVPKESISSLQHDFAFFYKSFRIGLGLFPDFFKIDEFSYYYIKWSPRITSKIGFISEVGYSIPNTEASFGFKNYLDYKAGLSYSAEIAKVQFTYNNTNRVDLLDEKINDEVFAVALTVPL